MRRRRALLPLFLVLHKIQVCIVGSRTELPTVPAHLGDLCGFEPRDSGAARRRGRDTRCIQRRASVGNMDIRNGPSGWVGVLYLRRRRLHPSPTADTIVMAAMFNVTRRRRRRSFRGRGTILCVCAGSSLKSTRSTSVAVESCSRGGGDNAGREALGLRSFFIRTTSVTSHLTGPS